MYSYLKVIGLIQARMNSTRLPGKVMLDLSGKPVIGHIYDRLGMCKRLDSVVISTGEYDQNKEICDYAKKHAIPYFVGTEVDLIDRIYNTALTFDASAIVRITSDCPLVDPAVVDQLVSEFLSNAQNYDIVTNCKTRTFPHGLDAEVYSIDVLKRLYTQITDPELREWFPIYIQKHPDDFRILNIENSINLSHLRLTLDYEDDFKLIEKIYENMSTNAFALDDVLKLFEKKPKLLDINAKYVGHQNIDAPT